MNFPCTTAALTLSPAPDGLRHLVLTRPGTRPSMRFLSVGLPLCARACSASQSCFACKSGPIHPCIGRSRLLSRRSPSRQPLAGLPLPSASSHRPLREHRYSYRGLSPHQFTPMPGVHNGSRPTPSAAAEPNRYTPTPALAVSLAIATQVYSRVGTPGELVTSNSQNRH